MSTYSDYQYPHREQHAQKVDKPTSRAAPSKLTEEQLLLLQQQWSQKTARLRSDQRSMRSARSSVSGVQYNRMNTRPVSSSCAGRAPTSFFDPPVSTTPTPTPSPFPTENTTAYRDRSFPGFAVARGAGYHSSAYATPDPHVQQQQQQGLLQPRLAVRRRTDADVGTGCTEQEEDISPVGRLRHRHTGAGALPGGRFGTFGGSPFAAALVESSTSSNYSSYAPYTPPNPAANARIARTFSLPGRCSTPSSTASLAGLQYAYSGNRIGGNFGAFLHGQGSSSGSSNSRSPGTPNSWATGQISTPAHSGLQPAFSVASTGSTSLPPAFSTVSNSSAGFKCNPGYTPPAAGVPFAPQAGFANYSSCVSATSGSWTPASTASSGLRDVQHSRTFSTVTASGPKSRRGSNAGLPPLAPTASAYSTYSASGSTIAAAAAEHQAATAAYQEDMRSAYSRVTSSGSVTVSTHRYSTAGSLCGEDRGYMASMPEVPYTYTSAAAAGAMASAAAAAAAAGISNSFTQHALYPGSFLPPLETVLTGQSELSEDVGSPHIPPGCIVSIFRALGIRRTPAKPRSPRRKTNGHKSRHSRKTNSHLGRVVDNCQQQDDVSNRKVMTLSLTSRQDSLADGAAAAQPVTSRQNSAEPVCLQQPPPQQQQQDEEEEPELGYPLAAAGPAAVAAAGVCEPAAAGSGAVMATTVLCNSSPRGIYRYSSPNAGNSHTYVPGYSYSVGGGVPYAPPRVSSSNGRRLSNPAAVSAATAAAASSRAVSAAEAAAAAAMAAAATPARGLKPLNRVQSIAKDLDPYAPKGSAASDTESAGYGSSGRIYRTPSTPGTARSYVSSSGSTAGAVGVAVSAAAAATPRGASVGGYTPHMVPMPLHASGNTVGSNESESVPRRASRSGNADSISGGSSGGSLRPNSYALQQHQQLQYPSASRSHRCTNAGSVISTISEQQQQEPLGYPPRSRRCSNAGSVISTISQRLDRTYAEVVCSPRGSYAGSVSGSIARSVQKMSVAYRASEPRQLQAVTGRGQLAWQPRQPGTTGYLSTQ